MTKQTNHHVAALAFPFGTHAAPLLTLIRRLSAASPDTIFSFFNTSQSNNSIFSSTHHNIKAYDVSDGVPEGYTFTGKPQETIELFVKAAPESLRFSVEMAVVETGREVTCLITDAFFWFGADMAEEMGVPWLPFWTAGPCSLSAHFYTDLLRNTINGAKGCGNNEGLSFIPGMSKVVAQDLPEGVVAGNLESVFSRMLHQMGLSLRRASGVLINSFEELDPIITNDLKSKFKNYLNVGPFDLASPPETTSDESGCLEWLDKQKAGSVVYISFGSVMVPPLEELLAIGEALEESGVPFIWSLKDKVKGKLGNGFLERTKGNGIIVPWAPQKEILSHSGVGVFVTHCGWNSLLESVVGGVPMICRPFFGDQRLNGRMVQDVWEIGVKVGSGVFNKEEMVRCLDVVFSREKGVRMRENIKTLQGLAKQAVGPKGSSTKKFETLLHVISTPKRFQE